MSEAPTEFTAPGYQTAHAPSVSDSIEWLTTIATTAVGPLSMGDTDREVSLDMIREGVRVFREHEIDGRIPDLIDLVTDIYRAMRAAGDA